MSKLHSDCSNCVYLQPKEGICDRRLSKILYLTLWPFSYSGSALTGWFSSMRWSEPSVLSWWCTQVVPRDAQGCVLFVSCLASSLGHLAFSLMAKKTNIVSKGSLAKMKLIPSLTEVISSSVITHSSYNTASLRSEGCLWDSQTGVQPRVCFLKYLILCWQC